jgi:hypothetical protein
MLNIDEVKSENVEEFSKNRKLLLKSLVKTKNIDESLLSNMIKNSRGRLKNHLSKFKNSNRNIEQICDLAGVITIDAKELSEVEGALIKTLIKQSS